MHTTWLMLWRLKDGEVWKEAGQHLTLDEALKAAKDLRDTGLPLQTVACEWRNGTLRPAQSN